MMQQAGANLVPAATECCGVMLTHPVSCVPSGWGRLRGGPGYLRKLVLQARQPVEFLHLNVAVPVRALGAEDGSSCWH